jgi:hypothetical protein
METVRECVECRRPCEPPLTYVVDAAGRLLDAVVCLGCVPDEAEPHDSRAELGGENG